MNQGATWMNGWMEKDTDSWADRQVYRHRKTEQFARRTYRQIWRQAGSETHRQGGGDINYCIIIILFVTCTVIHSTMHSEMYLNVL